MLRHRFATHRFVWFAAAVGAIFAFSRLSGIADSAPPNVRGPNIVAAGTATFQMGAQQDNATFTRVKLAPDITAGLGNDYIVLLTARFPKGGYPYFAPYWKPAKDGFDVTMVDASLGNGGSASYDNANHTFPIDWIVVKK